MKENNSNNSKQKSREDLCWFTVEHKEMNYIENKLWIPDIGVLPLLS